MSRRTYVIALAACLPASVLLAAAANGNAAAETLVGVPTLTALAGAGWYGSKAVIERGQYVPVAEQPEPGPGRRRAAATIGDTMAKRPRTIEIHLTEEEIVDAWGEQGEEMIAAAHAAAAEGSTTLTPPLTDIAPRTTPDPYVWTPDAEDTRVMGAVDPAASDAALAATGAWWTTRSSATSHWTAGGEDMYAGDRTPVATPS